MKFIFSILGLLFRSKKDRQKEMMDQIEGRRFETDSSQTDDAARKTIDVLENIPRNTAKQ